MITRRLVTAAAFLLAASPALAQPRTLSAGDKALVDQAVGYLQGLTQAKGRFVQTDARGGTTRGTVYLSRPGKARFEYDAPSGLLVVSDGSVVTVTDSRLKTFDRYFLTQTPLSLFLAKSIRLDKGVQVTAVNRLADGFSLTASDVRKQTAGQITLSFTTSPMALTGWTVTDPQRRATQVQLSGLTRATVDAGLFVAPKAPAR